MSNIKYYSYIYIVIKTQTIMKTQSNFITIDWKEAKNMIVSGQLKAIGSNLGQINNQGEYTISRDGQRLYKRRFSAVSAMYDLIAKA